jgi:hypothetical protein
MFRYARKLDEKHQLSLPDDTINAAVQASDRDYRKLLSNVYLLTLNTKGELFSSDVTESNIFRKTEKLFSKKLTHHQRNNFEEDIAGNPRLYANMVFENYKKVVGDPKHQHKQQQQQRQQLQDMDDISRIADNLSDGDVMGQHFDPDYVVDRIGSDVFNSHLVITAQRATNPGQRKSKLDCKFTTAPAWHKFTTEGVARKREWENAVWENATDNVSTEGTTKPKSTGKKVDGQLVTQFSFTGFGKELDEIAASRPRPTPQPAVPTKKRKKQDTIPPLSRPPPIKLNPPQPAVTQKNVKSKGMIEGFFIFQNP